MGKLSATIITKNEEQNIERCLKSVNWADEIVVVDSGSTDSTVEICRKYNCKIIEANWLGFGLTKKLAVNSACCDWILSIDADEEVTPELKNKILSIFLTKPDYSGYRIKRKSFYLGKQIKHCGWNRDYPLRLFNRKFGNFNEKLVHESVNVEGKTKKIEEQLLHFTYPTIQTHIQKMNHYTDLIAEEKVNKNKKSGISLAVIRGLLQFLKTYLFQLGLLDGKQGLILAINSAFYTYLKYIKLWEKTKK